MKHLTFIFIICFFVISCGDNEVVDIKTDYTDLIANVANEVILATYKDLNDESVLLNASFVTLKNNPTETNLIAARQAWINTRSPWEKSEGFLFGPVDQQGIDPSIDSWPVNQADLDNVLKSTDALTKNYIDGLEGTLKGFHTIEYLIFGADGKKKISDFNPRQFEYLDACSASLISSTTQLYDAWRPDKKNFIKNVLEAGKVGNTVYPSQKAVLQEIVSGLVTIADEVANGKINDPLSQQNTNLEESKFSANSKKDFADNMRSIQNAYLGTYKNLNGKGISSILFVKNASLDQKVKTQIALAISGIENIPGTFTNAIFNNKSSVEMAQKNVRDLQQLLEFEVLPIVLNL